MTAADWISDRRALLDAATEGPWGYQPWSAYPLPSGEYAESILLAHASPDGEIVRELPDNDAAAIADSRTSLPKALDALEAVLQRHNPHTATDCVDHWSECFVGGDSKCHNVGLCLECRAAYPCLTVQGIAAALGIEVQS